MGAANRFSAARWLRGAAHDIARSRDPRADRCIFQMMEDRGLSRDLAHSWQPTREGFVVECASDKAAHKLAQVLFADCACDVRGHKKDKTLVVALP